MKQMKEPDGVFLWFFALTIAIFLIVAYRQQREIAVMRVEAVKRGYAEWAQNKDSTDFCWK